MQEAATCPGRNDDTRRGAVLERLHSLIPDDTLIEVEPYLKAGFRTVQ